jgi:hypothetical protein
MRPKARFWTWSALALAGGLALRLWFAQAMPWLTGDALIYGAIAKNWLTRGVYGFAVVNGSVLPTLIRLPGYPLFDAMCFRIFGVEHYRAILNFQILLDLCTCLLLAGLAGRFADRISRGAGRRAALAALWLAALCPFTANYTSAPLTETLTIFTIALTYYAVERWRERGMGWNRWLWMAAWAMGVSILLRPDEGLLPAAVVPAMLWMQWREGGGRQRGAVRRLAPVWAMAVCILLPLGPWAWRNWETFHVLQPLAPKSASDPDETVPRGFNRWYATWGIDFDSTEEVYWNYDGSALDSAAIPARACDGPAQCAEMQAVIARYNDTQAASPELDAQFEKLAEERRRDHPVETRLLMPAARLADMWLRPRTEMMQVPLEWWQWRGHMRTTLFSLGYAALNAGYLLLAWIGFRRWRREQWSGRGALAWSMIAFIAMRCLLLMTLDNSEPRYTLECWPMVVVMAALAVAEMGARRREAERSKTPA